MLLSKVTSSALNASMESLETIQRFPLTSVCYHLWVSESWGSYVHLDSESPVPAVALCSQCFCMALPSFSRFQTFTRNLKLKFLNKATNFIVSMVPRKDSNRYLLFIEAVFFSKTESLQCESVSAIWSQGALCTAQSGCCVLQAADYSIIWSVPSKLDMAGKVLL